MARGRMVNKKISNSKRVNDLPLQAQLLYTWLIPHLDCNGSFYGDAQMIKSLVIPRKNWRKKLIEKWLVMMENSKNSEGFPLICRYTVNTELYLYMPGFVGEQIGLRQDKEKAEFPTFDGKVTEKIGQTIPLREGEGEGEGEGKKKVNNTLSKERDTAQKKKYGEFQNVPLTDEDLQKLKERYPKRYEVAIEELSRYLEAKGKKYKNYYAALLNWINRNGDRPGQTQTPKRQCSTDEEIAESIKEATTWHGDK